MAQLTDNELKDFVELSFNVNYLVNVNTGQICHKRNRRVLSNPSIGGYTKCSISGKRLYNHRVIYTHVYGEIPNNYEIDHINGIRNDNRIENLRCIPVFENRKQRFNVEHRKTARKAKKVRAYECVGDNVMLVGEYKSFNRCAKAKQVNPGAIAQIVRPDNYYHRTKSADGKIYTFQLVE